MQRKETGIYMLVDHCILVLPDSVVRCWLFQGWRRTCPRLNTPCCVRAHADRGETLPCPCLSTTRTTRLNSARCVSHVVGCCGQVGRVVDRCSEEVGFWTLVAPHCRLVLDICMFYGVLWRISDKDALVSFADLKYKLSSLKTALVLIIVL